MLFAGPMHFENGKINIGHSDLLDVYVSGPRLRQNLINLILLAIFSLLFMCLGPNKINHHVRINVLYRSTDSE